MTRPRIAGALLTFAGAVVQGCATSSHEITGIARSPVSADSVRVYTVPPAKYERIATINATSELSLAITSQQNVDKAIARLKAEAAKVGANGVLLLEVQDSEDAPSGTVGADVGKSNPGYQSGGAISAGGSLGFHYKEVSGVAIYVESEF